MGQVFYAAPGFVVDVHNPFNGMPYDRDWMVVQLVDTDAYELFENMEQGVFCVKISTCKPNWHFRLMDLMGYEEECGKNLIVSADAAELDAAKEAYIGHHYKEAFLRPYEGKVLVHSTPAKNVKSILGSGRLLCWNCIRAEKEPIGRQLGDPEEYSDYIMFTHGGVTGEIIVHSKECGYINMDTECAYEPGARFYLDAGNIAADGRLVRDGLHVKVKDELPLQEYLLWTATKENVFCDTYTPRQFAHAADSMFEKQFQMSLKG